MGLIESTAQLMRAKRPKIAELESSRQEILARISAIDGELKRCRKVERPAAMQSGDSNEIANIEQRIEALETEERALLARRGPIYKMIQAERVGQYTKDAQQKKRGLLDAAERVRDLRRQLAQAEQDLKSAVGEHGRMIQETAASGNNAEALTLDRSAAEDIGLAIIGDHLTRSNQSDKAHTMQLLMRGG